tara:strand:- start:255 stop:809 length:555 start_codon:yes stop_codon:yes gene_type:complete
MGRAVKNPPPATTPTKLVATGEYVLTQQYITSDHVNKVIWTYNYPKQKSASETFIYMAAQFCGLEAYSYAPSPCIMAQQQTANRFNGSQYYFGYGSSAERELTLNSCQNYAHSESLDGFSGNISSSNFGVGAVPIEIRWDTINGGTNRPAWNFCPNKDGSYASGNDSRGMANWYGYLRVWEIAY